jgi:hypothetical protein
VLLHQSIISSCEHGACITEAQLRHRLGTPIGLISPIVAAIQELASRLTSLEATVAGFAQSITSAVGNFGHVNTSQLCITNGPTDQSPVCVTKTQLAAVLSQSPIAGIANSTPTSGTSAVANPTPAGGAASTTPDTPPVIKINGDNPAIIRVGDTYSDLGATITAPQADLNLGIRLFLNGTSVNTIQVDTTQAATDTIQYVVTAPQGLTSTSTRTVIIDAAANTVIASSTPPTSPPATSSTTTPSPSAAN